MASGNNLSANTVVGTWRLLSIETSDAEGNIIVDANIQRGRGASPAGILTYTVGGLMSVQIVPTDRKKYAGDEPTGDEAQALLRGFTAYFGTYSLIEAEQTVIHHLQSHTNPNLVGTDYVRYYEVAGDRLTLRLPPVPWGDKQKIQRLYWERVG